MHEIGVTKEIIRMAEDAARRNSIRDVSDVSIVVGALSNYKPEAISFYYDLLKKESDMLRGSAISIEEEKAVISCNRCGSKAELEETAIMFCPKCDSFDFGIISGNRIIIKDIRGE